MTIIIKMIIESQVRLTSQEEPMVNSSADTGTCCANVLPGLNPRIHVKE